MTVLDPAHYTVAWIAPLEIEARAALAFFDEIHDGYFPVARGHDYIFTAGKVCGHHVILATLPPGQPYGTGSAGALAGQVKMCFPNLWFGLLVGVAAGLPDLTRSPPRDIRLGDVLVALPEGESAGLVAYDLGKDTGGAGLQLLHGGHALAKTETVIRSAIGKIKLKAPRDAEEAFLVHYRQMLELQDDDRTFVDPGQKRDRLYDREKVIKRSSRPENRRTRVWYGPIGSGEKLMRNAAKRDELRDRHGIIGLEMEAAGTINTIPVGVIRGVCDYADSHKKKHWQPYAAAMAAAYAKAVLQTIPPKKVQKCHFMVPFGRNKEFVGRRSTLNRILHLVPPSHEHDNCQRTVIEGLGGVGKTQIALEVVYRIRDRYPDCHIFWVPAVNATSFENAYRDIGRKLKVPGIESDLADSKALVRAAIDRDLSMWLLVIDNADDTRLLFGDRGFSDYLPSGNNGSILFTTRNHEVAVRLDVVKKRILSLNEMTRGESKEMLGNLLTKEQIENAASTNDLLDFLTDLPLAVKQASAFMARTGLSTSEYLRHCQHGGGHRLVELLGKDFNDRGRYRTIQNPVAATWLVSFQHILRDNPLAARFLGFLSCVAEKDIPKSILPSGNSDIERDEAIGTLKAYAFIAERTTRSYDMHRLVGLAMRNWMVQEGVFQTYVTDVVRRLDHMVPCPKTTFRNCWLQYMAHFLRALDFRDQVTEQPSLSRLLHKAGLSQYVFGKDEKAEKLLRSALDSYATYLDMRSSLTSNCILDLATVLYNLGKYDEAEQSARKALGVMHRGPLRAMILLGNILAGRGKHREAETMQREIVNLCTGILGVGNSITGGAMGNPGMTMRDQGNLGEAEVLRQGLQSALESSGLGHCNILEIAEEVGVCFMHQGKYKEAEVLLEQVYRLNRNSRGDEHPITLNSQHNLSRVLQKQGKYEQAGTMYRQVFQSLCEVLGTRHPSTLNLMYNLAGFLMASGNLDEAEEMYRQELRFRAEIFGTRHPFLSTTMNRLAELLKAKGRFDEAEKMYQEVMKFANEVLGARHPVFLRIIKDFACFLADKGNLDAAEALYRQASASTSEVLGARHHVTLGCMNSLALVLVDKGRFGEAWKLLQQVFQLRSEVLGGDHPDTLATANQIEWTFKQQGKFQEVQRRHQQPLNGWKTTPWNHSVSGRQSNTRASPWMRSPICPTRFRYPRG